MLISYFKASLLLTLLFGQYHRPDSPRTIPDKTSVVSCEVTKLKTLHFIHETTQYFFQTACDEYGKRLQDIYLTKRRGTVSANVFELPNVNQLHFMKRVDN